MHRGKEKTTFPLPNSSVPMALQNDFKTHDKTKYPFVPEYPAITKKPRCVKVILNSGDRQAGSSLTSATFKINLPLDFLNKKLNLVVDSFIVSTSPNSVSNLLLFPYYITIPQLRSQYTYHSQSGLTSGVILLTTGTSYFNNSSRETGGITITDTTMLTRPITIEFISPHFTPSATNGITNAWALSLSLWDAGLD